MSFCWQLMTGTILIPVLSHSLTGSRDIKLVAFLIKRALELFRFLTFFFLGGFKDSYLEWGVDVSFLECYFLVFREFSPTKNVREVFESSTLFKGYLTSLTAEGVSLLLCSSFPVASVVPAVTSGVASRSSLDHSKPNWNLWRSFIYSNCFLICL